MVVLLYNVFGKQERASNVIPYSDFRVALEEGKIKEVTIKDSEVQGEFKDGFGAGRSGKFAAHVPPNQAASPLRACARLLRERARRLDRRSRYERTRSSIGRRSVVDRPSINRRR